MTSQSRGRRRTTGRRRKRDARRRLRRVWHVAGRACGDGGARGTARAHLAGDQPGVAEQAARIYMGAELGWPGASSPFWTLTREVLEHVAARFGLHDRKLLDDVMGACGKLAAYPEAAETLRALK